MSLISLIVGLPIVLLLALTTIAVMKVAGFKTASKTFNGIPAMLVTAAVIIIASPIVGGITIATIKKEAIDFVTEQVVPLVADTIKEQILEPGGEMIDQAREEVAEFGAEMSATAGEARDQITEVGTSASQAAQALTESLTEGSGAETLRNGVDRLRESEFSDLAAGGSKFAGNMIAAGTERAADRLDEAAEGSGENTYTDRAIGFVQRMRTDE